MDSDSRFVHYLYIPLCGMRLGMEIHYATSLDGWDKEEAALQKELYGKLKKGYPWNVACTGVQGACEVATEWLALGKVFGWVFRGIGWGGKAVGRQALKAMSPRALMNLALVQITAQQGKKAVIAWSKQTIKTLLKGSGWKADVLPLNYARKKDVLYIIQKIRLLSQINLHIRTDSGRTILLL